MCYSNRDMTSTGMSGVILVQVCYVVRRAFYRLWLDVSTRTTQTFIFPYVSQI